ncbi:MAG TPA: CaiB/BaiF CoA-transferase family protein [Mycobacteriales bacterium]|nr:CaiB/BaiF CoA-transferase family protein [Mycobacteriales bacterium]
MSSPAPPGRPCDGIRVLDLTRLLPGGYATAVLADLGADVVKVEQPGQGDYIRAYPPYAPDGRSAYHLALNRGKRSVTLDLSTPEGAEILGELVSGVDVLVESFRPGVMDRLGIGYPALRAVNPGLVYVAVTGYGSTGSRAHQAGHDIDYLAQAGVLAGSGPPGDPWQPSVQVADIGGGALPAVVAVLAALRVRDRTGEGQFCDVSMTDGARAWLVLQAAGYSLTGRLPGPGTDTLSGGLACYRVYRCSDGRHVAVGALEPRFFAALVDTLGLPELAGWHLDPARQDELADRLAGMFATRTRDEWAGLFDRVDACVAPVRDLGEALDDEVAAQRGTLTHTALPDGTPFPVLALAPTLTGTPARPGDLPGRLGADTDEVLAGLGRSPAQIADLRARGVV